MLQVPKLLCLRTDDDRCRPVTEALSRAAELKPIRTLTELREQSLKFSYHAVLCGWSFHRTRWKDAIGAIRMIVGDLPIIFLSDSEDERNWKDALEAGAFDLLVPPHNPILSLAVLQHAMESYEARERYADYCGAA